MEIVEDSNIPQNLRFAVAASGSREPYKSGGRWDDSTPGFGRSVNHIPIWGGGRIISTRYPPRFFDLPTALIISGTAGGVGRRSTFLERNCTNPHWAKVFLKSHLLKFKFIKTLTILCILVIRPTNCLELRPQSKQPLL